VTAIFECAFTVFWSSAARVRHLCTKLALTLGAIAMVAIDAPERSYFARICAQKVTLCRRLHIIVKVGSVMRCPLSIGGHDDPYMRRLSQGEFARR
jgi:hypothetical protein